MNEKGDSVPKAASELSGVLYDLGRQNEELSGILTRLSRMTQTLCGNSSNSPSSADKALEPCNILEDFRNKIEYQVDSIYRIKDLLARLEEVV